MSKLVRVKLANGSEATVGEGFAKSHNLDVLDKPATRGGRALPEKHKTSVARAAAKKTAKKAAAKKPAKKAAASRAPAQTPAAGSSVTPSQEENK